MSNNLAPDFHTTYSSATGTYLVDANKDVNHPPVVGGAIVIEVLACGKAVARTTFDGVNYERVGCIPSEGLTQWQIWRKL